MTTTFISKPKLAPAFFVIITVMGSVKRSHEKFVRNQDLQHVYFYEKLQKITTNKRTLLFFYIEMILYSHQISSYITCDATILETTLIHFNPCSTNTNRFPSSLNKIKTPTRLVLKCKMAPLQNGDQFFRMM